MGFLGRLFKRDSEAELDRVLNLLGRGDSERALKLAERIVKRGGAQAQQARDLADRARTDLIQELISNADRSESAGAFSDAADWLAAAQEFVLEPAESLQDRITELREHAKVDVEREVEQAPKEEVESHDHEVDMETHFLMLTAMLREEVGAQYQSRDEDFKKAYIKLNTNQLDEAREELEALLSEQGNDPVLLLEAARCALFQNASETANEYLDRLGNHFGDAPLDLACTYSVPGLWAEVMMRLDHPGRVVERLERIADPDLGVPHLTLTYALALELNGQKEEAVEILAPARKKFPGNPWFPYHLARIVDDLGDWEETIKILEALITPSCAVGCAAPPKHLPSIRYLIALYLGHETEIERAGDLLEHLEGALEGGLEAEDLRLVAVYHRLGGDETAATQAEAAAEDLRLQGDYH